MSDTNNVRIILKRPEIGGRGELISEDYQTVDIYSEEIAKLLAGDDFFGSSSVVGGELINSNVTEETNESTIDF